MNLNEPPVVSSLWRIPPPDEPIRTQKHMVVKEKKTEKAKIRQVVRKSLSNGTSTEGSSEEAKEAPSQIEAQTQTRLQVNEDAVPLFPRQAQPEVQPHVIPQVKKLFGPQAQPHQQLQDQLLAQTKTQNQSQPDDQTQVKAKAKPWTYPTRFNFTYIEPAEWSGKRINPYPASLPINIPEQPIRCSCGRCDKYKSIWPQSIPPCKGLYFFPPLDMLVRRPRGAKPLEAIF